MELKNKILQAIMHGPINKIEERLGVILNDIPENELEALKLIKELQEENEQLRDRINRLEPGSNW